MATHEDLGLPKPGEEPPHNMDMGDPELRRKMNANARRQAGMACGFGVFLLICASVIFFTETASNVPTKDTAALCMGIGGLFFIIAGSWSLWSLRLRKPVQEKKSPSK